MAINNYGELKASVANYANRTDLDDVIPDFIAEAHVRLVEYAGQLTPMVNDEDTNALMAYDPHCYLWGALHEAGVYLADDKMMSIYGAKFDAKLADLAMRSGIDTLCGVPSGQVV